MTCIGNVCLCSVVGILMVYVLVIVLEVDLVLHLLRRLVLFKLMRHCVLLIPFHKLSSNSQIHTWKKNKNRDSIARKRTSLEKEKSELKQN